MRSWLTKILILPIAVFTFTVMSAYAKSSNVVNNNGNVINIRVYFPYNESYIDTLYMGNHKTFKLIDSLLNDISYINTINKIEITAQSSPEGSVSYNRRLSERRKQSLEEYFISNYPKIDSNLWLFKAVAENWDEFRHYLAEDKNLPNREEILSVVDGDRELDAKEWLLKIMDNGKPWNYIKENILPWQRYGASILFIPRTLTPITNPIAINESKLYTKRVAPPILHRDKEPTTSEVVIAIKSNLVLDALSVINLALEVPIGKRFSVVGEVVYPWWRNWPSNFTMQIESYHGELKYWLGDREKHEHLTGFSAGVYGGWGRYDIQPFSKKGVQGEFTDFGLQIGYAHKIAKSLHLEYTLGVGYTNTTYQNYIMANNTDEFGDIKVIPYPWINNSLKAPLPTRCGVSLVWVIQRKGGNR